MATAAVSSGDYVQTALQRVLRPTTAGGWIEIQGHKTPEDRRPVANQGLARIIDIRSARETFPAWEANAPATTAGVADWLDSVRSTVERLGSLVEGWDSYGGSPIDPRAAEAALSVLMGAAAWDMPEPSVVPTSQGGVQVEWHRNGIDLELEIMPPGDSFGLFFCDARDGREDELELVADLSPFAEALQLLTERGRQPKGR